ncbi:MAG TPA: YARHG domain-containing protein [Candidatus Hydrogenedentes bacterium]|nr:YARHG domain-containing protein [Candidatus Hydrogenedentota bacterium]
MKSEVVIMTLNEAGYTVDATFEFVNEGETASLLVGFPRWGRNGLGGDTMAKSFETWVDGEKVPVRDIPGRLTVLAHGDPPDVAGTETITDPEVIEKVTRDYEAFREMFGPRYYVELRWLAKDVVFEGGRTTTTRVRYKERYMEDMCGRRTAHYLYGTGRSWKGSIRRAQFIVRLAPGLCLESHPACEEITVYQPADSQPVAERLGENEFRYTLQNVEPGENDAFFVGVYPGTEPWSTPWNACDSFNTDRADRPVDAELLEVLPLGQLRLLRNAFFAVHGKRFDDTELQAFFGGVEWYVPRDGFKEDALSPVQRKNVAEIAEAERRLERLISRGN